MKYKKYRAFIALFFSLFCLFSCSGDKVNSLQLQVEELRAKEAIRELFTDYGRTLDDRNYAAFAQLYAAEAVYIAGGEFTGPDAIAGQLESVISANATGANLHIFSNEKIDVDIDAGTATAVSRGAFFSEDANGGAAALIFATYLDELVKTDDGWKFYRREVRADIPGPSNESRAQTLDAG